MLSNLSLLENYRDFFIKCLSNGFCRITKTKENAIVVTAPLKDVRRSKMSIINDPLLLNIRKVCYISNRLSNKNIIILNNIIQNYIEYYYIEVRIINGVKIKIRVINTIGKCVKKFNIRIFSINI